MREWFCKKTNMCGQFLPNNDIRVCMVCAAKSELGNNDIRSFCYSFSALLAIGAKLAAKVTSHGPFHSQI